MDEKDNQGNNIVNQEQNVVQPIVDGTPPVQNFTVKPKKKKLLAIVMIIVLLLVGAIAVYLLMYDSEPSDEPTNSTTQSSDENELIKSLDAQYSETELDTSEYDTSVGVYAIVNDKNVYSRVWGVESQNLYELKELDATSDISDECVNSDAFKSLEKTFKDNGFDNPVVVNAYSGGGGYCIDGYTATNGTETCTALVKVAQKTKDGEPIAYGDPEYKISLALSTSCVDNSEIEESVSTINTLIQIQTDTTSDITKENSEFYSPEPDYIKQSVNEGYEIAQSQTPTYNVRYYKTTGGKWIKVETNEDFGYDCMPASSDSADVIKAFEGESCGDYNSGEVYGN